MKNEDQVQKGNDTPNKARSRKSKTSAKLKVKELKNTKHLQKNLGGKPQTSPTCHCHVSVAPPGTK